MLIEQDRGTQTNFTGQPRVLLLRIAPKAYRRRKHPVGFRPPYPLKYVEALLKDQGIGETKCIDQQVSKISLGDIESTIQQWCPHVIVYEITTLNMEASGYICSRMAHPGQMIHIAVGQYVSADIRSFRRKYSQFDICLAGEAEFETVSVIRKFINGEPVEAINKSYVENGLADCLWSVKDVDALPFLHYDKDSLRAYHFIYPLPVSKRLVWGHMVASRGCPHPCIFCSQLMRESYGTKMRYRSPELVAKEMEHLMSLGANIISFDDEDFTTSEKYVRAVCQEILRRRLAVEWIIHGRVDELNEDLLKLLAVSGCILIRMGMESGNRRILQLLHKTREADAWIRGSKNIVKTAQSYGIFIACLFMVGSPTETKGEMLETVSFAKELNPDIIQVSYFTPFPGTRVYETLKDALPNLKVEELYHYHVPRFNVSCMADKDLNRAQRLFYRKFLLRPTFIYRHLKNTLRFYLRNPEIFLGLIRSFAKI